MKIKLSGAKFSAIVENTVKIKKLEKDRGEEFLFLNRGINAVVNIDLSEVVKTIDFNSNDIQVYPPNNGRVELKNAINKSYFHNQANSDNIFAVAGGMNGLRLVTEIIDVEKIYISKLYWGAYTNVMTMNKVEFDFYEDFKFLEDNLELLKDSAVIICDPNNPVGDKYDDNLLLELVKKLDANGTIIIWDSPYRRLFFDNERDEYYSKLIKFENLIIVESFSKSVGLSGQRLGFVHSTNKEFNKEFAIHILYTGNGINAFVQILVEKLLTTEEGKKAAHRFKIDTIIGITQNIKYLRDNNLLAERFYKDSTPVGIFVIVNKTFDELLSYNIGSVALPYFTTLPKEEAEKYSRISVSVPHDKFVKYFSKMINN